ncbi:hypothetical protein [Nonomuraea sp. NPDC049480]|uniref:hypothetical protein n=1 Tax=Nonomuraea sp. NPDC049480 TaxID=3364353 RepID=UPI0037B340A8
MRFHLQTRSFRRSCLPRAAINRTTAGNFRPVTRLLERGERVMKLNDGVDRITAELHAEAGRRRSRVELEDPRLCPVDGDHHVAQGIRAHK